MEITEVRVKLMDDSDDRLQAFCSITFDDCFVIRDLKIIDGSNGPFVAMPSRKLTAHCGRCGAKNHLRSAYCNHCGGKMRQDRSGREQDGRSKLYADIAHPINSECREMIQNRVIAEFEAELERAQEPGYASRYDDSYGDPETAAEERSPQKSKRGEHSHIEPAESEPRRPHTPPSRSKPSSSQRRARTQRPDSKPSDASSTSSPSADNANPEQSVDNGADKDDPSPPPANGGFGAGVFD